MISICDVQKCGHTKLGGDLIIKWEDNSYKGIPITGLATYIGGTETVVWFVCMNADINSHKEYQSLKYALFILTEESLEIVTAMHQRFIDQVGDMKDYGRTAPPTYVDSECKYYKPVNIMGEIEMQVSLGYIKYKNIVNPTPRSPLVRETSQEDHVSVTTDVINKSD